MDCLVLSADLRGDASATVAFFFATYFELKVGVSLAFNILGQAFNFVGTIINTGQYFESSDTMDHFDQVIQKIQIACQWMGVLIGLVGIAMSGTTTFWSGLGTLVSVIAWICVGISLIYHAEDPTPVDITDMIWTYNTLRLRQKGCFNVGDSISMSYTFTKYLYKHDVKLYFYQETEWAYNYDDSKTIPSIPLQGSVEMSGEITFSYVGSNIKTWTRICNEYSDTVLNFKDSWPSDVTVTESNVANFYDNIRIIYKNSADFDNDGVSNVLETETYLTDPENIDTDNDDISDGIELGMRCPYTYEDTFTNFNLATKHEYLVSELTKSSNVKEIVSIFGEYGWEQNHVYKQGIDYIVAKTNDLVTLIDWVGGSHAYPLNGKFTVNYRYGQILSDPLDEDSDDDWLLDGTELLFGTEINDIDSDDDKLTDGEEVLIYYTDSLKTDTDGDGLSDYVEVKFGYDPINDYPIVIDSASLDKFEEYALGTDPWGSTPQPWGSAIINGHGSPDRILCIGDMCSRQHALSRTMDTDWSMTLTLEELWMGSLNYRIDAKYNIWFDFLNYDLSTHRIGWAFCPTDTYCWQRYIDSVYTSISNEHPLTCGNWANWIIKWDVSKKDLTFTIDLGSGNVFLIDTYHYVDVKQLTNLKIFNSAPNGQDIGIDCIGYSWNIQNSFTQFAVNADPLYDDDWSLLYGSATITSSGYELTSGRRRFTYFNDMSQDWSFNFLGKVQYINDDTGGMGRYILQLHSSTDKYVNFAYGLTSENFEFKISTDSTWTQADDPDAYPNANEFNQWKVYWDASEFKLQFFFKGYLVCETTLPDGFGSLDSIIFDSVTDGSAGKVTISDYSYNIEDEIPYSNSVDYKGTETFFNFADGSDPWFGEGTAQIINMYQGHHKVYELIDANRHQDVNLAMSQDVVTEAWVNLGQYNSSGSDLPFAICDEAYIYSSQHLVGENVQYKLSKQEIGSVSITGFVKDTDYILVDSSDADTYMDSIRWTGTNRPSEGAIFRVTYSGIEHIDYGGKTLDYYDGRYVMSLHLNNDQKFSFGFYTSGSTIKYQYKWSGFGSSWYDLNWNIANGKDMQWMRWRISWLDAANKFKVEVFEQDNDYTYSSEIQVNELSPMYVIAVDYDCSENTGGFMYIDSPSIVGDGYSIGDLEDTIEAPQIVKIEPNYNENSIDFVWEDADTYNIGVYYSLDSFDIDDIDDFADSGMLPSGIFYNGPFTGGYGSIYLNKGGEYTLIFQSISETCTSFYAEPCVLSTIVEDTICDFSSDTIGNPPSGWIPFTTYSDHTHTVSNDLIEFESGVFQYSLHERLIDNSKLDTITGTYSGHSHEFEIDTDYSLVDSNSDEEYDSILWDNVNHPDVDTDFVVSYQYLNYEVDQTELVEECSVINEWYTDHPITTIPKMFVLTDTSPLSYSYATMSSPIEFEGDMFIDMRLMSDNTQKYSEISFRDEQGATILTFSINHGYLSLQLSDTIYENITMIFNYTLSRFRFNFNTNEQLGQLYLDDIYIGEYQIENCSNIAEIKIATSIAQSDYFIAVDYIACGQQSDSEIDNVGDVSYTFSDTSNVSSVEKELSSTSMENGGDIQGNYYYSADKFAIYDISSISNTELTDLEPIYLSEQSYQDVQVVDNFIYALGTSSITIYDSSDKSKPVIVNSLDIWTPYTIIDTQLIISGHILYLLTEHNGLFVRAYDISNPLDIGLLDTLDTGFIRDSGDPQVKIETLTQNYVLSFIDDADSEGKILLIDISNPNDLAICSTIDTNVVGGINCIATSFGYVYGSYVDTGANKIKIYDIINHYDPRLVATKDISGSYPIYSMDIFENSLYINRQTATGPDAFIFEIYALSCRTNPVYKCSVSPDISGEIILSSNIAIISGTSAIDILQIHYSSDGLDTEVVKGQTMGITTGSIDFQKNTQGIFSVDFLCPEEYNNIMIGLDSTYSGTPVAKFSAESSEMKIFDLYDLNFDLWYTPGDSGTAKIVNVQTPISTSAYEIDNTKRTIVTNLDTDTVDFTIEAMIAIEKESSTTGTYSIQLIDSFGEVFIDLTYNPNTQKWTTLGYQINGGSAGTPDSCEFGTWKIGWSAESFKFYFNGDYIGSQNRINMPSIIKKVVFDDVTAGNCGKMWIAGYRVNSYTEDLMDIIEPELVVGEINTIKVLFDCTKLNAMIFANGNFEGIFSMFEGSIHAENGIPYLNSVSFSSSLLIDNLKWTSLDEDLDKDGLPNECFYSTSSTDADSDDDGMPDGWEIEMGLNPLVNDASGDPDDDGLTNLQELTLGTSAICTDSDHDYMSDGWEVAYDLNPIKPYDAQLDSNDDGISNLIVCLSSRIYLNTYPLDPTIENPADSDGDTMPDAWEMFWRLDPTSNSDKEQDPDSDYLTNYMECAAGTNPYNKDTDDDTMWDKWELDNDLDPLDPEDADDDNDQDDFTFDQNFEFRNDDEFFYGLNPNDPDTDDDTYPDGYEVYMVTHPSVTDADQDQMIDSWERTYGFRPYCKDDNTEFHDGPNDDWDFDGLTNIQECNVYHTYPKVADSDGDGLSDGVEVNTYGTDPMDKTTDADSLEDGFEVLTFGSNPFMADTDSDGLDDGEEYLYGTNPNLQDTDDDGLNDGPEVKTYATNPLTVDYDNDGLVDGTEVAGHQYWDPFKQGGAGYITVYTLPKVADTDGDGLLDGEELGITETHHDQYTDTPLYFATLGSPDNYPTSHGSLAVRRTNPNDWDSDNDGASDGDNAGVFEWDDSNPNDKHWKTDPLSGDTDGDTLGGSAVSDYTEMHGWDIHYDSDSDTVLDTWLYGVTSNPRKTDSDGDNIGDLYEYTNGYNPNNADWDGDGLKDNEELLYMNGQGGVHYHHQHDAQGNPIEGSDLVTWTSNPWDADTDGDGLTDHEEMHGRDPTNHPTWYSNPNTAHSDSGDNGGDTLTDYEEYWGTFHSSNQVSNPRAKDTDNDGYNDYIEEYFCYNPSSASSYPSYYYDYSANTCTQVAGDQITVEGGSSVSDAISFSGGASYVRDRDGWPYVTSYEIKYKFSTFAFPTSLTYYNRKSYISAVGCSWKIRGASNYSGTTTVKELKITVWNSVGTSDNHQYTDTWTVNTWYPTSGGGSIQWSDSLRDGAKNNGYAITTVQVQLHVHTGGLYNAFVDTDMLRVWYYIAPQ